MRRIVLGVILLLSIAVTACAQGRTKRFENIFLAGGGPFLESGSYNGNNAPGLALRLSYGLDIRIDDSWSIMPGIGATGMVGDIRHLGWVGSDTDDYTSVDAFCDVRYHAESEGARIVLGLGPSFCHSKAQDTYYIDADPSDPRNRDHKFRKSGFGLRPSITFEHWGHFKWGIEANVGIRNMRIPHPGHNITGTTRFNNILIFAGIGF